jgi:Fe(3+) dicitrate transport protein
MRLLQLAVRAFAAAGLLALLTSTVVQARQARVSGEITDAVTGAPLARVTVLLEPAGRGTATDPGGRFAFDAVPPGDYVLVVSSVGFAEAVRPVAVGGRGVRVDVALHETTVSMDGVVVERASMTGGLAGLPGIPGSAHYLSPRELSRFAHQDIHRVLRSVPGVNVQEEDGYGLRPNIGIRGTGSERSSKVTVMEDGIPITPAPYAASAAYFFPVIGRMHAVEVRKGASQIRYGPATTGGAINLVTAPIPRGRSVEGRLLAGQDRNLLLHARAGDSHGRFGWLVEGYRSQTDGFKRLDGGGDTGFDRSDLMAKLRLSSGEGAAVPQSLLLKVGLSDELSNETYLGLTDADFAASPLRRYAGSAMDRMDADQRQVVLRHAVAPGRRLDVVTTAYHTRTHRNWYKLDRLVTEAGTVSIAGLMTDPDAFPAAYDAVSGKDGAPDATLNVKANNRIYRVWGVQTEASLRLPAGSVDAGIRLHRDEMDRFQWVDGYRMEPSGMVRESEGVPGSDSNRLETARALAAWTQVDLALGRLSVQPGLRLETVEQERLDYGKADPERTGADLATRRNVSTALLPGLGLSYRPDPYWAVFAGVHRGYGPPGTTEGARPESSVSYEAGARHDRQGTRLEAVAYYTDYGNLLGADLAAAGGEGSTDLFNGGAARVYGLELSGEVNLGRLVDWAVSIPARAAYTFTDAAFASDFASEFEPWGDVQSGYELPYVARHQGSASLGVETDRASIQVSASRVGPMRTVAGTGSPAPSERIGAHLVVDLAADYAIARQVSLFATVRNVGDVVYIAARRPAGIRPGLPRTVMAGLRFGL